MVFSLSFELCTQQEEKPPSCPTLRKGRKCWSGFAYLWGGELGFVSIHWGNQEHVLQDGGHVLGHDLLLLHAAVVLQGDDDRVR